jgi:hypothetical protein
LPAKRTKKGNGNEPLGFEQKLWAAADKMRGHMDPAEYKHVALGLIFLKYISDAFEEKHSALLAEAEEEAARSLAAGGPGESGVNPEDRDEYLADNVFWVPREARWEYLQANAKQPEIGKKIDDAMVAIERESARAKMRVMVKRLLRKHGYPPDKQEHATQLVLAQAELVCEEWAAWRLEGGRPMVTEGAPGYGPVQPATASASAARFSMFAVGSVPASLVPTPSSVLRWTTMSIWLERALTVSASSACPASLYAWASPSKASLRSASWASCVLESEVPTCSWRPPEPLPADARIPSIVCVNSVRCVQKESAELAEGA